jgi:hypothetical protein
LCPFLPVRREKGCDVVPGRSLNEVDRAVHVASVVWFDY